MINFTAYLEFKLFSLSSFSIPSPSDAVLKHTKKFFDTLPIDRQEPNSHLLNVVKIVPTVTSIILYVTSKARS